MHNVMEQIKAHPAWIIGGAVVLLLLLSMRGSSTATASTGVSSEDAAVLQQSALNAQTSVALGAQGVTNNQTAASLAAVQSQVSGSNYQAAVSANSSLSAQELGDIMTYGVQSLNASTVSSQSIDALTASLANTSANEQVQSQSIAAAATAHTQDTNAQLTALGMNLQSSDYQATMNNNLQTMLGMGTIANSASSIANNFSLGQQNLDITAANLPSLLSAQENIAASNASAANAEALAQANLTNAKASATTSQSTASSTASYLGDAATVAELAAMFM